MRDAVCSPSYADRDLRLLLVAKLRSRIVSLSGRLSTACNFFNTASNGAAVFYRTLPIILQGFISLAKKDLLATVAN